MIQNAALIIQQIKETTGAVLACAFDQLPQKHYSENDLMNAWLAELRRDTAFHEDGWYAPPPHGVISLFGKPAEQFERICRSSFRPQAMWPQPDRHYEPTDVIALYASPVHRRTCLIGDFGLTLYRGGNHELQAHCERVLATTLVIAGNTKPGMSFKEIYTMAMDIGTSHGLENKIASTTDRTGTNIGHTIPLSYASDPTHSVITRTMNFADLTQALSEGRKFINAQEAQQVEENMAFTIEPRFSSRTMPNVWFHLTVVFENGTQSICHGFRPILQRFSMNRLLSLLP